MNNPRFKLNPYLTEVIDFVYEYNYEWKIPLCIARKTAMLHMILLPLCWKLDVYPHLDFYNNEELVEKINENKQT